MFAEENHKIQNKIIREVAKDLNLDDDIVYKVVRSQWDLLKQVISEEDPDKQYFSLKIRQLGIFGIKNFRFKIIEGLEYLHVPKDKIVKHIDPRKQDTN